MMNVEQYLLRVEVNRKRIKRAVSALSMLSLFVVVSVFWNLRLTGITIANSAMCKIEEHFHTEECFISELLCELDESTHVHSEQCFTDELICQLEENTHVHNDECFQSKQVCEAQDQTHVHSEQCFTDELICQLEENTHTHNDECFHSKQVCELQEQTHVHNDECFYSKQVCELDEHIHDFSCFSNASADVETAEVWEATLPKLTDNKAKNIVQIALSQVGYVESKDNFTVVSDSEIRNGITRYGQWYGSPYGDWSNMFTSFCLTYAGVVDAPMNSGAEAMRLAWLDKNIYRPLGNYDPVSGDILYLDKNQNEIADTTAVIISIDEEILHVVEGDVEGKVVETSYDIYGGQVMGYGVSMPRDKVLMMNSANLDDTSTIASTVTYSSSIFTSNSQFVIYTVTSDNRYFAIDGHANAVEIYIDSSGNIKSNISDPNSLYWSITSSNEKYDNQATYYLKNVATGYYLHPYNNSNTDHGAILNGQWDTAFYNSNNGVKFRGARQNAYAYLSGTTFTNVSDRNTASTFYFGRVEYCTLWLDGTNGGIMSSNGSKNKSYSVMKGGSVTLPQEWSTPSKYYYKLNGWVDVQTGNYYRPGEEMIVTGNTVLYADWVANSYDIGKYNSHVVDTISTKDFVTTKLFDYNSLFNMLSSNVSVNVSSSSHSETWSHVANGNVAYKGQPTLNFSFNDHDSSGKITNLNNLNSENKYTGGGVYEGIYNDKLGDALFNTDTAFNSKTGEGLVGKHYLGEADYLFQFETDPSNEYYGYYYYDSKKNASSYNQTEQRFYVYNYLGRTSDSSKESDDTQYSDFVPLNSPYANNPGRNVATYNYGGDNGEYTNVVHYQYDSRYSENGSSTSNLITNFWFGMSVEIDFYLPNVPGEKDADGEYGNKDIYGNDMNFKFAGDDDVWVLLDDTVILDIGGIHKVEGGDINFSTGKVTNGNSTKTLTNITAGEHKLRILYVERGSSMSNCAIYFNLAPQYSLTIQKEDVFTQNDLNGAAFSVYTDAECKNLAHLWTSKESYTKGDSFEKSFKIVNGKVTIWGFGASNVYYIRETSPPTNSGYSIANGIIKLKLDKNGIASYSVEMLEEKDQNGNSIPISKGFTVHGFKIDEEKQEAYIVVTNAQSWVTETTSIYVDKKWKDSKSHAYDSVIAYLNIVEGNTVRQIREITLSESNDWKYVWVNLPKFDQNGNTIIYSVTESYFPGYTPQIEELTPGQQDNKWNLVESYSFVDGQTYILKTNQGYLSANNTTENILKFVDEETAKESDLAKWTVSVNGNNITFKNGNGMYLNYHHNRYWSGERYYNLSNQSASFMMTQYSTGLSIYYTSSNAKYYLTGINTNGTGLSNPNNPLIIQPYIKSEAVSFDDVGYRIINTPLDQETSVKVTKEWEHPADDSIFYEQDKITVHLLVNGLRVGRTVTLSLKNNWTDTFKGLPYKDADGNVIEYTVEEGNNSIDWIPVYGPIKTIDGSTPTYETTITNQYRWTGKVDLPSTGGLGYPIYILIGSFLVIGPFVYSFKMRKKHEGRSKK